MSRFIYDERSRHTRRNKLATTWAPRPRHTGWKYGVNERYYIELFGGFGFHAWPNDDSSNFPNAFMITSERAG